MLAWGQDERLAKRIHTPWGKGSFPCIQTLLSVVSEGKGYALARTAFGKEGKYP
jgi:hypothetical protein